MPKKIKKAKQLKIRAAVINFLVCGIDELKIKRSIALTHHVTQTYAAKMIKSVLSDWAFSGEENMRVKRQRAILARKRVIANAWAEGNHKLVLEAEDSLTQIEGTRYDSMIADDNDIRFEVTLKQSKREKAALKEYEDELENPGAFERRQEKQVKQFMERYDG